MAEYIYVEPNRSKGEGARNREAFFLELADSRGWEAEVKGTVVDEFGSALVRDFSMKRDLVRKVSRAIKSDSGILVVPDNKLGR